MLKRACSLIRKLVDKHKLKSEFQCNPVPANVNIALPVEVNCQSTMKQELSPALLNR